jgi:hypothetical protein
MLLKGRSVWIVTRVTGLGTKEREKRKAIEEIRD